MSIIHVAARRWTDRTYGNTYHSVALTVDGETKVNPFEYGYGDHYMHTAGALFGLADPYLFGRRWAEEKGHKLTVDVLDVPRRRDLHNGGKA